MIDPERAMSSRSAAHFAVPEDGALSAGCRSAPGMLPRDEVQVWLASLDLPDDSLLALERALSDEEWARAARFRFERDRLRFTAARGILRTLISGYLDAPAAGIRFQSGPRGKPGLAEPAGDLRFNLSHSDGLGLFAFAWGREVGVDVERIRADVRVLEVAERFFSPREAQLLAAQPPALQTGGFFACWTRKEAFVKARGDGLSLPLCDFDVGFTAGQPDAILRTAWDSAEAERWKLLPLDVGRGYDAALVVKGHDWTLRCCRWWPGS